MIASDEHAEKIIPLCDAHKDTDKGHSMMNI